MVVFRIAAEHHTFNRFDDFCPLIHSKAEFMIPLQKKLKKPPRGRVGSLGGAVVISQSD